MPGTEIVAGPCHVSWDWCGCGGFCGYGDGVSERQLEFVVNCAKSDRAIKV